MKWLSSHHWIVVCFQASVLSVVVQLPGPVQVSLFAFFIPEDLSKLGLGMILHSFFPNNYFAANLNSPIVMNHKFKLDQF